MKQFLEDMGRYFLGFLLALLSINLTLFIGLTGIDCYITLMKVLILSYFGGGATKIVAEKFGGNGG